MEQVWKCIAFYPSPPPTPSIQPLFLFISTLHPCVSPALHNLTWPSSSGAHNIAWKLTPEAFWKLF
jgi:hypothetical protein